jgi:hypothetical protein
MTVSCKISLVAVLLLVRPLAAQTFHGTVRDSATRQPVAGAVVMALDSAGVVLGRRVTDERGEFRLSITGDARWARVVRIGFLPREIRAPSVDGDAAFDVSMVPVPTMLAAVTVRDESHCARRSDRAAALGLWEQARAGLLATVVARETNTATVHRLGFDRMMDETSDKIVHLNVTADSISGAAKSFNASHTAKEFVKTGFVVVDTSGQSLFGPDADVLLDDAFASAYCFRIADPVKSRPREVGLAFAPASGSRPPEHIDIEGTLWVDTSARALRDIEFRYVGMPSITDKFRPGGRISFRQMPNGIVMIDRWYIRGVALTRDTIDIVGRPHQRTWMNATETGGELARAAWPNGETWRASLGALRIHAVTLDGAPARGAAIALPGTQYRGAADSSGNLLIGELVPGPYAIDVIEPRIAALGIWVPTPAKFVAARDSTFRATLTVPTAEDWVANRCIVARQWDVGDSVFVIGRVVTPQGNPVADAKVTFAVKTDKGFWGLLDNFYTTGSDGVFQSCSRQFVLGAAVKIRVTAPGFDPTEVVQPFTENLAITKIRVGQSSHP